MTAQAISFRPLRPCCDARYGLGVPLYGYKEDSHLPRAARAPGCVSRPHPLRRTSHHIALLIKTSVASDDSPVPAVTRRTAPGITRLARLSPPRYRGCSAYLGTGPAVRPRHPFPTAGPPFRKAPASRSPATGPPPATFARPPPPPPRTRHVPRCARRPADEGARLRRAASACEAALHRYMAARAGLRALQRAPQRPPQRAAIGPPLPHRGRDSPQPRPGRVPPHLGEPGARTAPQPSAAARGPHRVGGEEAGTSLEVLVAMRS